MKRLEEKKRREEEEKRREKEAQKARKNGSQGAIYGIPMSVIESRAQPGESAEDVALRVLEEARAKRG